VRGAFPRAFVRSSPVNTFREILPPTPHSVYTLKRRWLGTKVYWIRQILGWGMGPATQLVVFLILPDDCVTLPEKSLFLVFLALEGIFFSHLLRIVYLRCRDRGAGWKKLLTVTAASCYFAAGGMTATTYAIVILGNPEDPAKWDLQSESGIPDFINFSIGCWISFLFWSGCYFATLAFRQYRQSSYRLLQMDAALKEAKLRALREQMNPHFLFNSLNTIRAMIPRELTAPRDAVTNLADFLRSSLTSDNTPTISLADELEVVRNYLSIEKLRLEERLRVDMEIDPAATNWPIPPFLLQTVVENAVKYGVARNEIGGPIHIRATIRESFLRLTVINHGTIGKDSESTRTGIRNSKDRLALLYGPSASLAMEQSAPGEVTTSIVLPHSSAHESDGQPLPLPCNDNPDCDR